jgi:two-component system, OmpR family, phosphate regulon response regulator PhoB
MVQRAYGVNWALRRDWYCGARVYRGESHRLRAGRVADPGERIAPLRTRGSVHDARLAVRAGLAVPERTFAAQAAADGFALEYEVGAMTTHLDVGHGPAVGDSDLRSLNDMYGPALYSGSGRTILVAEEDHAYRAALCEYLEHAGYRVSEAADGPESLRAVFQQSADLVILDLALRGGGAKVLTKIRRHSAVPVIVCSGRDSEHDRIRLLNLGADDYLIKPVSFAELEARVRAVLRRGVVVPAVAQLDLGELVIDLATRIVTVRGEEITMTRKEFDLLTFLASSPGQVFSREELLERVWRSTAQWQARSTVTEHVRRVRQKIEPYPGPPRWITTVRGMGYRFSLPDAS